MFCPSCGLEERQPNQFCRACGIELRAVRRALEAPDQITLSANSAREEIGRAFATKIREMNSAKDLKKVVEDVLPQIEEFLESPEEKRMRGLRKGVVCSFIGLGGAIGFALAAVLIGDTGVFFFIGLSMITLFIGLGLILNALLFTVPRKVLPDKSKDARNQRELDSLKTRASELNAREPKKLFSSVTENTTQHLE